MNDDKNIGLMNSQRMESEYVSEEHDPHFDKETQTKKTSNLTSWGFQAFSAAQLKEIVI